MIRLSRHGAAMLDHRARLKQDLISSAPLREIYPWLAEVRVELDFEDGTTRAPSAQAYSYFPGARGFFRYACPCHDCSGEFDLSAQVAELAEMTRGGRRSRRLDVPCPGHRTQETSETCPICARVRVSAVPHNTE
jgi:hypothetical protein